MPGGLLIGPRTIHKNRGLPDYIVEGPRLFIVTTSRKSQPLRVRLLREFLINAYAQEESSAHPDRRE